MITPLKWETNAKNLYIQCKAEFFSGLSYWVVATARQFYAERTGGWTGPQRASIEEAKYDAELDYLTNMSRLVRIPSLRWEHRPELLTAPWYADVFDETGYTIVPMEDKFYASRYQWSGKYRDTVDEAKADAEANYQETMKRLLQIEK